MKNKIFITILLVITLSSCGFSPVYIGSSKQVIISKSEIVGDKDLAFNLEQKLNFKKDEFNVVIQINGKKRAIINAIHNETEESIFSKSLAIKNIKVILEKTTITKKIFVKNKLLNIVTNEK